MAVLHSTHPARPVDERDSCPCDGSPQCRGRQCTALSPHLLALKSARRLVRALFSQAQLVLRGHPGVSSWLSHEGLSRFEWRFGHELAPPSAFPFGEVRWGVEVCQEALK